MNLSDRLDEIARRAHADGVDPADRGAGGPMTKWVAEHVRHDTDGFYLVFILGGAVGEMRRALSSFP